MKQYRVTLKHDGGTVRIRTAASSPDQAAKQVCRHEHAPDSAVHSIEPVGKEHATTEHFHLISMGRAYQRAQRRKGYRTRATITGSAHTGYGIDVTTWIA